jgi:hypothetical protein
MDGWMLTRKSMEIPLLTECLGISCESIVALLILLAPGNSQANAGIRRRNAETGLSQELDPESVFCLCLPSFIPYIKSVEIFDIVRRGSNDESTGAS